jgi:hypothetical protein
MIRGEFQLFFHLSQSQLFIFFRMISSNFFNAGMKKKKKTDKLLGKLILSMNLFGLMIS